MEHRRGDVWWADLPEPRGSEPGYRRPVLIVQADPYNASRLSTIVVAAITSNVELARARGNVLLRPRSDGLPKESVINVTQVLTVDRRYLIEYCFTLSPAEQDCVDDGLRTALGL